MNIINTTVLRNNLADALSEVAKKKDFLLVAKKGKITSAIVNIDLFEDLLALAKWPTNSFMQDPLLKISKN
ncbi:MAG: hypothetical protein UT57_C0058G0004 [Microgenomates group bacterium GW2011_GWC1_39_7]|nr:MAG: hypothetical protein UT57_C0058G0004 [Microgenomates group bacterium GW2011_GWC1_39_7]